VAAVGRSAVSEGRVPSAEQNSTTRADRIYELGQNVTEQVESQIYDEL
jgi:hypothetical protein